MSRDWRRLGFCWVCVLGSVVYDMACEWWICDRCGVVAITREAEARRAPTGRTDRGS